MTRYLDNLDRPSRRNFIGIWVIYEWKELISLQGRFRRRFGLSGCIMHHNGKEFENRLFAELETLSGVESYHPQCNGAVERMHATMLKMLRQLPENHKSKWY